MVVAICHCSPNIYPLQRHRPSLSLLLPPPPNVYISRRHIRTYRRLRPGPAHHYILYLFPDSPPPTLNLLLTTLVPPFGSFSVTLPCVVSPVACSDVVLGIDWAAYVRDVLLDAGYHLNWTIDAWRFFCDPSRPLFGFDFPSSLPITSSDICNEADQPSLAGAPLPDLSTAPRSRFPSPLTAESGASTFPSSSSASVFALSSVNDGSLAVRLEGMAPRISMTDPPLSPKLYKKTP
ncbi:hypothetical protein C8R43DRAFT_1142498 [Mycena crocata]|nr:hypothetical protein C8R43DRAFT_1142498 [Mycena crocata]